MMTLPIPARRGRAARRTMACMAAALCFQAQAHSAPSLPFESTFGTAHEATVVHFAADYVADGKPHHLQVWRDGQSRLKRITDDAVETYVFRKPGEAEFQMSIIDRRKHIHTLVSRTNLYRIGNFSDWFDLAHGLRHPKGTYVLSAEPAPAGVPPAISPCTWYLLSQQTVRTHVCWSRSEGLPMLMLDGEGKVVWRIATIDHKPVPASAFLVHGEGYVRNDANADIEPD